MDKATVESVMALAFELARIREQHGAQSGMYLSEVRALRAEAERLAAQAAPSEEKRCACNDRPASGCPGEWEPGCDLGNNSKYVRVGQSPAQAPVQAGEFMPLHAGNGNRHGPLSAACDNVLAWRLGEACNAGAKASAGDLIDRGLVLLHELRLRGFLVVQASDADRTSSGATPAGARMLTTEEIADCCNGLMRDNSAIETWIRRAVKKAFAVNAGKRIPADGVIGGV